MMNYRKRTPVFGQLSNVIDMAVVAALISKEQLAEKAGHNFSLLLNAERLPVELFYAPHQVDSRATMLRKGQNWVISVSGGVAINPWALVDKPQQNPAWRQAARRPRRLARLGGGIEGGEEGVMSNAGVM